MNDFPTRTQQVPAPPVMTPGPVAHGRGETMRVSAGPELTEHIVTMPDGSERVLPDLNPETVEAAGAAWEREQRVGQAAEAVVLDRMSRREGGLQAPARDLVGKIPGADAMLGPPGPQPTKLEAGMREFAANATLGLNANARAALDRGGPLAELDFDERRDAFRLAQEMERDISGLSGTADAAWSLGGVLAPGGPVRPIGRAAAQGRSALPRVVTAGGVGAATGAAAGAGFSEGETPAKIVDDAVVGAITGSTVGAGLQVGAETAGGALRSVYARSGNESRERLERQEAVGYRPTIGSVGNESAASLQQTLSQYGLNVSGGLSAVTGGRVPSLSRIARENEGVVARNAMDEIESYLASPAAAARGVGEFNAKADPALRRAEDNLSAERQRLGEALKAAVPASTPTSLDPVRAVPRDMRRADRDVGLVDRARNDVARVSRNRRSGPVDPQLDQMLERQIASVETGTAQVRGQIAALRRRQFSPQAQQQADALEGTLRDLETGRRLLERRRYENLGVPFQAMQDWRSELGRTRVDGGPEGLPKGEAKQMYGAASRAMDDAGGPIVGQINRKFVENYADDEVVSKFLNTSTGRNFNQMDSMLRAGDFEPIRAVQRRMNPDDWQNLSANYILNLGMPRGGRGDEFNPTQFGTNWRGLPDEAKGIVAPTPEQRAILDAYAAVADDLKDLGAARNHSNSAAQAGILGTLAVGGTTAVRFLAKLTALDSIMASKAVAEAVAGRPNELQAMLRQALVVDVTTGEGGLVGTVPEETAREFRENLGERVPYLGEGPR